MKDMRSITPCQDNMAKLQVGKILHSCARSLVHKRRLLATLSSCLLLLVVTVLYSRPTVTITTTLPTTTTTTTLATTSTTKTTTPEPTVPTPIWKNCIEGRVPLKTYPRYHPDNDTDLSVVSAYFNIGRFKKGLTKGLYFNATTYMAWVGPLSYMYNQLIFYTDSPEFEKLILTTRQNLTSNLTRIVRVTQDSIESFKLWKRISKIYSDPKYPKFTPNTVSANYSCAMHAKYDVVEDAILKKYVTSNFVTWLDVGYFRDLGRKKPFKLVLPKNFSTTSIAVNRLYHKAPTNLNPENIFKGNRIYVGGGMIIGQSQTFLHFVLDYRHAVSVLLDRGLSDTDQQVLYAMYNSNFRSRVRPVVDIQLYIPNIKGDCWFYLGYQCYREL